MKNKTFFLTILASLILILGFEISAGRIRFGAAYWNDSTTSIITGNKNALINGQITARDSIDAGAQLSTDAIFFNTLGGVINFGGYNSYIQEDVNKLYYATTTHKFTTPTGTDLLTIDSANGLLRYEPIYGSRGLIKTKYLQSTLGGTTPNNYLNIAHGISDLNQVIDYQAVIYEDSSNVLIKLGYNVATAMNPGNVFFLDATNAKWFMPAAAGNLKNAGDTIRWEIRYLTN